MRLGQRPSDGVVLAREAADHHVDVGDGRLPALGEVENLRDVLVHDGAFAEAGLVAAGRELAAGRPGRLPLVRPNGPEGPRLGHVEFGPVRVGIALEAKPEPADAREELGHLDFVGHISPIAAVSYAVQQTSLLDLAKKIKIQLP